MPSARRTITITADVCGNQRSKLVHPTPDSFAADFNPSFRHQFFNVADAQREAKIPTHRLTNDRSWKPVTLER